MSAEQQYAGPGPNIIRAWFDTVINPLIEALLVEHQCLARRDWTWNHWQLRLERINAVEQLIVFDAIPNLLQFLKFNPPIQQQVANHDALAAELWTACNVLQNHLSRDPRLLRLLDHALSGPELERLGTTISELFSSSATSEERTATVAEYMINSRGELPSHYSVAPLWNVWRTRLCELLNDDANYRTTIDIGSRLYNVVSQLISMLRECREHLSIQYDVPIFDAGTGSRAA